MSVVPSATSLKDKLGCRLHQAAALGIFQSKYEAIVADLDALKNMELGDGIAASFAEGAQLTSPEVSTSAPPEEDRYLVADADFSQERVVWKARQGPGLVVHGPPGTGKSQTIANLIADALAHGRTVLTVCQKQAATRVVMKRLRSANLADLCVEVNQPEADRTAIFTEIRAQVSALSQRGQAHSGESQRAELAREITSLVSELDKYARALHEKHPIFGLSYRQLKHLEGSTISRFPTVRPLTRLLLAVGEFSAEQLDELCNKAQTIGNLYRSTDPLTNPWRHRQPSLRISAIFKSDVVDVLRRLAELDARHIQHIERAGPGVEQQVDTADLLAIAPEAVRRLRPLTKDLVSGESNLIRHHSRDEAVSADRLRSEGAGCRRVRHRDDSHGHAGRDFRL